MKDVLPPYGVILRDAIATGDRDLMRAYLAYSDFVMSRGLKASGSDMEAWKAAHSDLEKAVG